MRARVWVLALLFLLPASRASALEVVSTWVLPLRLLPRFDLAPYERTKPILFGDAIYVADQQGRVAAIHRIHPRVLWERTLPGGVEGAFALDRSKLVVGDRKGNLFALNAHDGTIAWQFSAQSEWLAPPVIVPGFVFAVTASGDLFALSENKGEEIWHYARHPDEKMTVRGSGGPAVYGTTETGTTEVFQGFADGTLVALKADKGQVLWERKLATKERFHDVDTTPFVDEKRVVAATFDGKLYSLDRVSGDTLKVFPVGCYGGFLVKGNRMYFAGVNHQFYAMDLIAGQPVWTTAYEGGIAAPPVLIRDTLIFPTSSDPTYLVDRTNGNILGKIPLGAGSLASAVASEEDGWFYLLSNYGNLYSFALRML